MRGLREIEPYVAGRQPQGKQLIKLNTNENAYGPSPRVAEALADFNSQDLRKYSTLDQEGLCQALGKELEIDPDWIIIGNGSDMAFTRSGLISTISTTTKSLSMRISRLI